MTSLPQANELVELEAVGVVEVEDVEVMKMVVNNTVIRLA